MSLPVIRYEESQQYYLEPLGEPEIPKFFTSQQQCRNYYDLAKSEIQLYHDGSKQTVVRELRKYIHNEHTEDLCPIVDEYEDRLATHTSEFWCSWELKIDEISQRYDTGDDEDALLPVLKDLQRELDTGVLCRHEPVWFMESRMTNLQKAFRAWPNLIHLKTLFNLLNQRLPITALLWKQMSDVSMLRKSGEFGIYYHANVLDVIRRLTELLVRNAYPIREQYMRIRQHHRQLPPSPPASKLSEEPKMESRPEEAGSLDSGIPQRSPLRVLPPGKRRQMSCMFCGSSDGHVFHKCELLEYVISMGILSLNRVGTVCDPKGEPFDFEDVVPWCRSARFRAYLAKETEERSDGQSLA